MSKRLLEVSKVHSQIPMFQLDTLCYADLDVSKCVEDGRHASFVGHPESISAAISAAISAERTRHLEGMHQRITQGIGMGRPLFATLVKTAVLSGST